MITPEDVYERYLIKSERNGTNDNFSTDRGKVVLLYNELAPRVVKYYIRRKDVGLHKDIQTLLVDDKELLPDKVHLDHTDFKLPEDFLDWSFARCKASNETCKEEDIRLFEIKDADRGMIDNTDFSPSFSYREFPYEYSNNYLKIFNEQGTTVDKAYLSYYRYPTKISLEDKDDPESKFISINIDLEEEVLNRVISAMVGDFKINNEDPFFQADKLRQNENNH